VPEDDSAPGSLPAQGPLAVFDPWAALEPEEAAVVVLGQAECLHGLEMAAALEQTAVAPARLPPAQRLRYWKPAWRLFEAAQEVAGHEPVELLRVLVHWLLGRRWNPAGQQMLGAVVVYGEPQTVAAAADGLE
jgi:hypothetical protein